MDNAQKAIMIGVGLFITIIVIAAVMLITGMGQDMLVSGQQEVSNISSSLEAQLTSDFDGSVVSGGQVITAVKRFYKDPSMVVMVNSLHYGKKTATVNSYEATDLADNDTPTKIGTLTDKSNANYVANTGKYKANLIKQGNVVVGVQFEKIS